MEAFQQRVMDEKLNLDAKKDLLMVFLQSDLFKSLPNDEQERLTRQGGIMEQYSSVLAERIEHFK